MANRLIKLAFSYIGLAAIVLLGFLLAFIGITEEMREHELEQFDSIIIGFVQGSVSPYLTKLMLLITMAGSVAWITVAVIIVIAVSFLKRKWRVGLFIGLSSGVGSIFNIFLKELFKRQRPDIEPLIVEQGFSFPSGHSMGSMIFYGAAAFLVFHYAKKASTKTFGCGILLLIIFMIGISRIYLGVHYPSDIIGGFTAGGAWLTVCIILFFYFEKRRKVKEGEGKQ
ncbi:PAP2 family protein [Neobacillus piezotolerans]|uniref:PAP2 family protein n=1 Tax=Neobacillus piezotolerans TaxID=2259171 RepID=A0A3D8GPP5_9BACI|nr:phosphatase PAP2 family protein [Neobacillus piezotolerans]RDU36465.1 PAP2 family protein [Neobacillus piezotolerans]